MKTETSAGVDQRDIDALLERLHLQSYEHEVKLVQCKAKFFILGLTIGMLINYLIISWI